MNAASAVSDLAPDGTSPSRQVLIAFGLTGTTGCPASSSRSTRRPFGRSMATGMSPGTPYLARRRISVAIPSAECSIVNSAAILPPASITHTACVWGAQSIPVKNSASGSARDTVTPQDGSDGTAAARLAPGWSLTGALRRVPLLPVCSPGRTGGGSVMPALHGRPNQAVTPAPAESQQQAPY